jgi:hypothetical protein
MRGNGDADGPWMKIVDPENGSRYEEPFRVFLARYEGAFILSQGSGLGLRECYQIRHFLSPLLQRGGIHRIGDDSTIKQS